MQDKDLQLSARDKVVQKMSRDGAVENNISAASSHRISNRILDATLQTEKPLDGEFGGRAKHKDIDIAKAKRRYGSYVNKVQGNDASSGGADSTGVNTAGNRATNNGFDYSDTKPGQGADYSSNSDGGFSDSDIKPVHGDDYGDSTDGDNASYADGSLNNDFDDSAGRLSEHNPRLQESRHSGIREDTRLKTDSNRRMKKRRVLEKYHESESSRSTSYTDGTGKNQADSKANNIASDKKKATKKKQARLRFDDEIADLNGAGNKGKSTGQKGQGNSLNAKPYLYEAGSGVAHTVKEAAHSSDVSDSTDDNVSSDALSAGKSVAERSVAYEKKSGGRLLFESDKNVPGSASTTAGSSSFKASGSDMKTSQTAKPQPSKNKRIQKQRLKREYATAFKDAKGGKNTGEAASKALKGTAEKIKNKAVEVVRNNPAVVAVLAVFLVFGILISSVAGTAGAMASELGGAVTESTYLSSDNDILKANEVYEGYEDELQDQVDNIESAYPGYDEYRYQVDEITHDPYALTSYLTAKYGNFKYEDIKDDLKDLFQAQFTLTLMESTETRTRTVTNDDGTTSTEEYEVTILAVKVTNNGLDAIANESLGENQKKIYAIYQASLGNRSYLFGDSITIANPADGGMSYEIPPEALDDEKFANMIAEAEKYLGYPYVWGGSSPSTSFDCSGFVSYVINNCGNGWNVGRSTANGLRSYCTYVSASDAKPGDLIFFQGTYNTSGASHVGIYVGNGMMIHCGNPIQYTSINSNYWKQHFLAFGRIND